MEERPPGSLDPPGSFPLLVEEAVDVCRWIPPGLDEERPSFWGKGPGDVAPDPGIVAGVGSGYKGAFRRAESSIYTLWYCVMAYPGRHHGPVQIIIPPEIQQQKSMVF